ncbi:MAG TPA: glycosyltransferase family 39 protein [Gemmatimonadaceae bacterium]
MRVRVPLLALSSLMLLALVLRVMGLAATNLWLDEANSWLVATLPWHDMIGNLRASPLGPLYFVALKLWIGAFGDSAASLRAPSLVAGVLLVPVTWAIAARATSRRAAALGAALVALSPLHLYFSREARMYMPLALLGALFVLAYLRWSLATFAPAAAGREHRHGGIGALAAYALLAAAAMFTNPVAALLIVAVNVDALIALAVHHRTLPRPRWWRAAAHWAAAQGAIAVLLLGVLAFTYVGSAGSTQLWRPALGVAGAARELLELPLTTVHGLYYYSHDFWRAATDAVYYPGRRSLLRFAELLLVGPGLLLVLVAALAAAAGGSWRGARRTIALAWIVPTVIGAAISVWRELDLARYTLYATPFLLILVADGIDRMRRATAALSLATLLGALVLGIVRTDRVGSRDSDYRPVARVIAREWSAGPVIVQPREMAVPLMYYLRDARPRRILGVGNDQSVGGALNTIDAPRAWVVLDYRSPLYNAMPDSLRAALGHPVISDDFLMEAGSGVRVVRVGRTVGGGR